MQNLQEVEFNKFILQNLAKYMPGDLVNNVPQRRASNISTLSNLIWNVRKPELVSKLWPMTVLIGICEVVIGLCLLVYICLFIHDYDTLYNTEDSKLISYLSVFGCAYLMLTGLMLLFALMLENQESIRIHIFMAVIMCVYMFVLACVKIHLSLLVIERDAAKLIDQATKHNVLLSLGCVIGVATLLGSGKYYYIFSILTDNPKELHHSTSWILNFVIYLINMVLLVRITIAYEEGPRSADNHRS